MPRPFGSRSLQWRRDTSSGGTSDNSASSLNEPPSALNSVPAFGGNPVVLAAAQLPRPLTYIRNATKSSNENAGKTEDTHPW